MKKIPQNIKAAIFDMDGLLINSEPYWKKVNTLFFEAHSLPGASEFIADRSGMGLKEYVLEVINEYDLKKDVDHYSQEFRDLFYKIFLKSKDFQVLSGGRALIKKLIGKTFRLALATGGHTQEKAKEMLHMLGLSSYFSVIISSDEVKKGKPSPDVDLTAAKKLNVLPRECLVLEDSVNGVKAGIAAGMTVFAVNKDPKIYNQLQKAGADEVFSSLTEVRI